MVGHSLLVLTTPPPAVSPEIIPPLFNHPSLLWMRRYVFLPSLLSIFLSLSLYICTFIIITIFSLSYSLSLSLLLHIQCQVVQSLATVIERSVITEEIRAISTDIIKHVSKEV